MAGRNRIIEFMLIETQRNRVNKLAFLASIEWPAMTPVSRVSSCRHQQCSLFDHSISVWFWIGNNKSRTRDDVCLLMKSDTMGKTQS